MINLRTGLPGAGKTLSTLVEVKALAEKEGRPVYYSGIADLQLPWTELEDATKWHELPPKSIIVIDEAQRVFRPRHVSSAVPEHVAKLETHRHLGVDLFLITQHPKLIDPNVRRLCGSHSHVVRAFGSKLATIHAWQEVKEDCDKSRSDSIVSQFAYPKEAFDWYKSAEAHTHKMRLPARFWLLVVIPLLIAGLGYAGYSWINSKIDRKPVDKPGVVAEGGGASVAASVAAPVPAVLTPSQYAAHWTPRIDGIPHSAPAYDALVVPKQAPFIAGCVAGEGSEARASVASCRCYTEQGTRLDVDARLCQQVVERGQFQFWKEPAPSSVPASQSGATSRGVVTSARL